ncbi:MAG: GDSL-type esterase/lipase family protein, partial [Nevskiaceae bacterium]|nr:GDSL-type esterase/lipase family protein [Nevskiaceae bacterium]
ALGGNDRSMNFSREQTKQTLRRIIQMCLAIDAKVFLADRAATTDNDTPSTPSLYAELAAEEGVTLIPALNEGVAGDASLLLSDMQHPNADGYAIIAARMLKVLGPALRSDAR